MTDLPTGVELDRAVVAAKSGELAGPAFAAALLDVTFMLAVVARSPGAADDAVDPFVISIDGIDYGVAFSGSRTYARFTAATPFVLLAGRDLGRSWPARLGLAINPGDEPSLLLGPDDLRGLLHGEQPAGRSAVPAGTPMRIGAPDPGLPETALDLLRRLVRSDAAVQAAYPLAVAVGDAPVELIVGVEAVRPGAAVAETFAARVLAADAGFRGLGFLDLGGPVLASAQAAGTRLA